MTNRLKTIRSTAGALFDGFRGDARGNVAVITALCAVPLFAAAGIAVDYSHAVLVRTAMQAEADAAALAAAAGGPSVNDAKWVTVVEQNTKSRFGSSIRDVAVQGKWISATDFSIDVSAAVPVTLLSAIPSYSQNMDVKVVAVARYAEPVLEYKPPTLAQLDPDAADYNRMYVYCYDPSKKNDPKTAGRTQETAVADNAGTKYSYTMPQCGPKEALAFHLHNVRNARTTKSKWDSSKAEHYEYYTDTVISGGKETYSLPYSLLETVLCNTAAECKPKNQGGIIVEGANRTPTQATSACTTGKYLYYGWEDRPPEQGGSDREYNDIRIIMECPSVKANGAEKVALIK
jgi:Flp pilus assembly protein TadG